MKILVTGVNGQLGFDVINELKSRNIECKGVDISDFDITNKESSASYIGNYSPDAVIHCAAYTAVDKAEDNEALCRLVNAQGTGNLAEICSSLNIKMLYISTDYVYGGGGCSPFDVTSPVNPQNVYGKTKLEGEMLVKKYCKKYFIIRTSWVFGVNGNNFVKTMLKLSKDHDELNVVCDQIGSPTYTPDLAVLICDMILSEKYGTYHGTNENFCSWADFACEIMKLSENKTKINPITSDKYPSKAERPKNSRLSKICLDKAGFNRLPTWQDALSRYLKAIL